MSVFNSATVHLEVNKEQLANWYIECNETTLQIAQRIGCSEWKVLKLLRLHNIPVRPARRRTGALTTIETRQKISKALKGRKPLVNNFINPLTGRPFNYKGIIRECAYCHGNIEVTGNRKKAKINCCDRNCWTLWWTTNIETNWLHRTKIECYCDSCTNLLIRLPAQVSQHNFCDSKCLGQWLSKNKSGAASSRWKGGYEGYYGESWVSARRTTRKRDNDTCQNCFRTKEQMGKNLDVHHKIPFRTFGVERHLEANSLTNLVCFCASCHKTKEEFYNKYGVLFEDYSI